MPSTPASSGLPSRRVFLFFALPAAMVILFTFVTLASAQFHTKRHQLSVQWSGRAQREMRAGRPSQAVEAIRNALVYDRENPALQLELARALTQLDRPKEARAYLMSLWAREPGSGEVNLELARLASAENAREDATRYYHNAIYGQWDRNPEERRRQVRSEMTEFLLRSGQTGEADAELVSLAAEAETPAEHARIGQLFLRARDYDHALQQFQAALKDNRNYAPALAGAGVASFQMGRFGDAEKYLARVGSKELPAFSARLDPGLPQPAEALDVSRRVQALTPLRYRMSSAERGARTERAYQIAMDRLRSCAPAPEAAGQHTPDPQFIDNELAALYARGKAMQQSAKAKSVRRNPDLVDEVLDFAGDVEDRAAKVCGAPSRDDVALGLIAHDRESGEQ